MMTESTIVGQSRVVRLDLADRQALYAAYMPFVTNGGLFVNQQALGSHSHYDLGSDVFLMLYLADIDERLPIAGKVIWITPRGGGLQRPHGIGIQFASQDNGATRNRLETLLAGRLSSDEPTYTL